MSTTSWYRSTYFSMKGNKEYCRGGFEAASARFNPADLDVDCTGRHVMITGANKGMGQQTAHELAKRGAVLHLVCRNMDDARATRATIVSETGNDKVHLYQLDLSRPRDVVQFCKEFCSSHDQLHVLVNNAGVMRHERVVDEDGVEFNFAVNTLAMHLLVVGLMPLLESCADSRVVTVSSAGMLTVKLDAVDLTFDTMEPFNGRLAYSQTKRQQVVLTLCYAQYYSKVHFSSMHPGWVDTLSVRSSLPEFYEMYKDKLRSPAQGADTIVWLAASPRAISHSSGLFFQDREPVSSHLPLAWTRTSVAEEKLLLDKLQEITERVSQPCPEQTSDVVEEKLLLEKLQEITERVSQPHPEETSDSQSLEETKMSPNSGQNGNLAECSIASEDAKERVSQPHPEQTSDPQSLEETKISPNSGQNGNLAECPIASEDAKEFCQKDSEEPNRQIEAVRGVTDPVESKVLFQATEESRHAEVDSSNSGIEVEESLESKQESDVNLLEADNKDASLTSSTTDQSATDSGLGVTPEPIRQLDEEEPQTAEDEVVAKNSEEDSPLTAITTNLEAAKMDESVKESTVS